MNREPFVKLCHDLSPSLEGQATLKDANAMHYESKNKLLSSLLSCR